MGLKVKTMIKLMRIPGKMLINVCLIISALLLFTEVSMGQNADSINQTLINHPTDPETIIDGIVPKPGVLFDIGVPQSYFDWKDEVYNKAGLKFGVGYQLLFQAASDVVPNAENNTAMAHWTGFLIKWTLINRKKGKNMGQFVFSIMDRRLLGNNALPASFGIVEVGGITTNVEFTSWSFAIENLYWEQWLNFKRRKLMIRIGNQVATTVLNPFRFKDSRTSFTTGPFCFHPTMPYPTFGFGASFKLMPNKGTGFYIAGSLNDMNGDPNLLGLDWSTVGRGEFFYGAEVGYNWKRSKDDYDHVHLIIFGATERSTREPLAWNKAGWGFSFLGEKQFDRLVLFANYTFNTAQGGGVTGTLSDNTITTGVAYKNPLQVRGEVALGLLYMNPIEEIMGDDARNQFGLEAYWHITLTRNIHVTPGIQLVFNPSVNTTSDFIAIPHIKFRVAI